MSYSPPFRRKMTWYERQKKRKSSPFFRLLKHSSGFRLLLSAAIAFILLATVNRFENCHSQKFSEDCLSTDFWSIISVGNVESFSIVTAALLYILEGGRRKQQEHREASETILRAQETGAVRSLGRIEAIETLSEAGLWLDGIDLHGANLEQLEVPYARLRGVNFANTVLTGADLRYSDLTQANFTHADLSGANLTGANLTDADLSGANLTGANLTDADLSGANLTGANLTDANLTGTKLDLTISQES
jgi:hypothetical protein